MKAKADTGRKMDLTVKICLAALGLWVNFRSPISQKKQYLLDECERDLDLPHDKVTYHNLGRYFCR